MEQKQSSYGGSVCEQLLHLSAKCPWFIAQNLGAENNSPRDQIFYTLHDPLAKYQCQIPELIGRRIQGYYHGWIILSGHPKSVMWSLWNPITSKMINFPPLTLKDGDSESIEDCCLSAPPDDPSSVLLLTRANKPSFVFFRLKGKRKKLRWTERSYASQLKRIAGQDGLSIYNLTCCNGKVYALSGLSFVIQLDILVKDREVLIKLLLLGFTPFPSWNHCTDPHYFLKGHCTELFCIIVGFYEQNLEGVYFFRLDMTSVKSEEMERFKRLDMSCKRWQDLEDMTDALMSTKMWEELVDFKEAIFFVDIAFDCLVFYRPAIALELGGYIHIRDKLGKVLYSYHVKDNTISLSSMPSLVLPTSNVSVWECRLEDDHGEAKCTDDSRQEEDQIVVRSVTHSVVGPNEFNLPNLPFDILELIMNLCVGLEYMTFRTTCKCCLVAAPLIQWSTEASSKRLKTYSLVSPWLLVVDKNQGIITFTDPMSGDNYFKKNLHVLLAHQKICCSMFGWLLFKSTEFHCLVFFNPFTSDLRKLSRANYNFMSMCFSAPPTSPNCIVVGFPITNERLVLIHYVGEPSWRTLHVVVEPKSVRFPTFIGQDLYALGGEGELIGFKDLGKEDYSSDICWS